MGGLERITFELASGLAEWSARESDAETLDVTVVTRTAGNLSEDGKLPFRVVRRPGLYELVTLVRENQLLHLAGPAILPLAFGLLMGKSVAIEHHGFQTICPNGQFFHVPTRRLCKGHYMAGHYTECFECNLSEVGPGRSAKMLLLTPFRRWLAKRAGANITPTAWLATVLKLPRVRTVYHGISLTCDNNTANTVCPTFAFQGRLVSTKGAGILLEAAKQLRAEGAAFLLKIIGDGPERRRLEAQAEPLGPIVQFLGHLPDESLARALSDVSAVVVPSLAGEVFGLVVAENMLRGKVLIVSNISPLKELVGDTGLITLAGNAEDLASCMRRVIEDPSLIPSLGSAAQERATHLFGRRGMIQSHLAVYQGIMQ